jgi:hypothetical protein
MWTQSALTKNYKQMKNIVQFGLAALAAGAFLVLPGKAETPDIFTKHGLPIPGAYFKNKENQQPATVAVSKSGQGVGEQKQAAPEAGKKHTKSVHSTKKGS